MALKNFLKNENPQYFLDLLLSVVTVIIKTVEQRRKSENIMENNKEKLIEEMVGTEFKGFTSYFEGICITDIPGYVGNNGKIFDTKIYGIRRDGDNIYVKNGRYPEHEIINFNLNQVKITKNSGGDFYIEPIKGSGGLTLKVSAG